ncbi:hypothetical protein J6590_101703, partial [Homalodisca vitripennis]
SHNPNIYRKSVYPSGPEDNPGSVETSPLERGFLRSFPITRKSLSRKETGRKAKPHC